MACQYHAVNFKMVNFNGEEIENGCPCLYSLMQTQERVWEHLKVYVNWNPNCREHFLTFRHNIMLLWFVKNIHERNLKKLQFTIQRFNTLGRKL